MRNKLLILLPIILFSYSSSNTLKEVVSQTLKNNPKIQAIKDNTKANRYYIDENFGEYLPTLDYQAYIQDKKIIDKPLGAASTTKDENGDYQQLKLQQNIYNGGLTSAKVQEAKHNHRANLIANISQTEKLILDTVISYLDYTKYEELNRLTINNLEIHSIYLETAIETEEVSGDIVDRLVVEEKILTAKEKLIQLRDDRKNSKSLLEKNLGKKIGENICRPNLDYNLIPNTYDELISTGVKSNYKVLEEIEKIRAQKAIVSQELSRFLPSIDFQLLKEIDDGIDTEEVRKNNQSARLTLTYNFFNGLKDEAIYKREKLFLKEAQKNLDSVSADATQRIESQYNSLMLSKEKLELLYAHVDKSKEILKVFSEQFDGGTRSFIDVLNQEEELYRIKSELIEEEYKSYISYFSLLFELSRLSDTLLVNGKNSCEELSIDYRVLEDKPEVISEELESLLSNDGDELLEENLIEEENPEVNEEIDVKEKVNKVFNSLLDDIYNTKSVKRIFIDKDKKDNSIQIKEENKIEKIEEELNLSKENKLKEEFIRESSDKFTIVLATIAKPSITIEEIVSEYNMDNVFAYKFRSNGKDYVKVLYNAFDTTLEARKKIATLNSKILRNGAFVDNINKHQYLYKKNNSLLGDKIE